MRLIKTTETIELENALMEEGRVNGGFGCPEVTVGWHGRRRVDFVKVNWKGVVKCFEIKVSKSDFYSKHGHNFVGDYNYYVLPKGLYDVVKKDIPKGVGVLVGASLRCVKKAAKKKAEPNMVMYVLRSLSREAQKGWLSKDKAYLQQLRRQCDHWERMAKSYQRDIRELQRELRKVEMINRVRS